MTDKEKVVDIIPQYKLPRIWPGYILGFLFLLFQIRESVIGYTGGPRLWALIIILGSLIYWCICVYKIHKIALRMTDNNYPITPGRAVGFSFIPFYNLYWMFKWPAEILNMVNTRIKTQKYKTWIPGLCLLLAYFAVGFGITPCLFIMFGTLSYIISALKKGLAEQQELKSYSNKPVSNLLGINIALTCCLVIPVLGFVAVIAMPRPNLLGASIGITCVVAIPILGIVAAIVIPKIIRTKKEQFK